MNVALRNHVKLRAHPLLPNASCTQYLFTPFCNRRYTYPNPILAHRTFQRVTTELPLGISDSRIILLRSTGRAKVLEEYTRYSITCLHSAMRCGQKLQESFRQAFWGSKQYRKSTFNGSIRSLSSPRQDVAGCTASIRPRTRPRSPCAFSSSFDPSTCVGVRMYP